MARVQSVDDKAVFVFVGDVNAHHSEWLESALPLIGMCVMQMPMPIHMPLYLAYWDVLHFDTSNSNG